MGGHNEKVETAEENAVTLTGQAMSFLLEMVLTFSIVILYKVQKFCPFKVDIPKPYGHNFQVKFQYFVICPTIGLH